MARMYTSQADESDRRAYHDFLDADESEKGAKRARHLDALMAEDAALIMPPKPGDLPQLDG